MKKNQLKLYSLLFVSHLIVADTAFATTSIPTPWVVGHKPTVDNVRFDKTAPVVGDTLNLLYDYQDIDEDVDASTIKWFNNGAVLPGKTGSSYTLELNIKTQEGTPCSPFQIAAEVTAKSVEGDPLIGDAKRSATIQVALPAMPGGFTFPPLQHMPYRVAENFCRAKGMTLPTYSQLDDIRKTYHKSKQKDYEISKMFGWPLYRTCGGGLTPSTYWARSATDVKLAHHVFLDSDVANVVDADKPGLSAYVTCVPGP
ncbi:hypothetical protein ACET5Y_12675 [Aeromonas veronii]|uniref:hypothetical protein n=1 Tax=Aeromonas TaxID=642 RepID=UPI001C21318D|nr:hypothetical protein [Aeromonas sp. FDAARGOS 1416]QXB01778.1 hypothetical protein I6L46_20650 [Aeromonas sp. FDAARGOS 1416]